MKEKLAALVVAATLLAGCKSSADTNFYNTAEFGVQIVNGQQILDCYSNSRPTIVDTKPDPTIIGQEFKCKVIQGLSGSSLSDFESKAPFSLFVDKVKIIRGEVNEIPSN